MFGLGFLDNDDDIFSLAKIGRRKSRSDFGKQIDRALRGSPERHEENNKMRNSMKYKQ